MSEIPGSAERLNTMPDLGRANLLTKLCIECGVCIGDRSENILSQLSLAAAEFGEAEPRYWNLNVRLV